MVVGKDDRFKFRGGINRREDLAIKWKDTSGWSIHRVGSARDVSCEDLAVINVEKGVDSFEILH